MPDEFPVDVLTELGRVTWAAIKLEDYVEDVCSRIDPSNDPLTDKRFIGRRIADAKKALAGWAPSATRDEAGAWLERAWQAIGRRNAILHAIPITWAGPRPGEQRPGLGEKAWRDRRYFERPLTVESLGEIRSVLEDAATGWPDLALALSTLTRQPQGQSSHYLL
jgi:hypothetical protein